MNGQRPKYTYESICSGIFGAIILLTLLGQLCNYLIKLIIK